MCSYGRELLAAVQKLTARIEGNQGRIKAYLREIRDHARDNAARLDLLLDCQGLRYEPAAVHDDANQA